MYDSARGFARLDRSLDILLLRRRWYHVPRSIIPPQLPDDVRIIHPFSFQTPSASLEAGPRAMQLLILSISSSTLDTYLASSSSGAFFFCSTKTLKHSNLAPAHFSEGLSCSSDSMASTFCLTLRIRAVAAEVKADSLDDYQKQPQDASGKSSKVDGWVIVGRTRICCGQRAACAEWMANPQAGIIRLEQNEKIMKVLHTLMEMGQ